MYVPPHIFTLSIILQAPAPKRNLQYVCNKYVHFYFSQLACCCCYSPPFFSHVIYILFVYSWRRISMKNKSEIYRKKRGNEQAKYEHEFSFWHLMPLNSLLTTMCVCVCFSFFSFHYCVCIREKHCVQSIMLVKQCKRKEGRKKDEYERKANRE